MRYSQNDFANAIQAWRTILGERVQIGPEVEISYSICTFPVTRRIPATLLPHNQQEIIACVRIAQQYKIPLYTISTGNNWGYGSANPVVNDCVMMDLSHMNKIIDMDEELGLITLEPGVTQGQLCEFLREHHYDYMVPTTGAGPTCSIVGNVLERGYGITPHADHFAAMMSLEAVLADGSVYQSAHHSLGAFDISKTYKWGIGPYIDGLFSQGGFGIVTQMTIALARRPDKFKAFIFEMESDDDVYSIVPVVHHLLNKLGSNIGGINLMNDRRILAVRGIPYPRSQVNPGSIMSSSLVTELCKQHDIGAWTGLGAIYNTSSITKACQKEIKRSLKPYTKKLLFLSIDTLQWVDRWIKPFKFLNTLHQKINTVEKAFQILNGNPNETALKLAYWKSAAPHPENQICQPDLDNCGLLWFAPLVPMRASSAEKFIQIAKNTCEQFGVEPLITLSSLNERCFDCTIPILFDKTNSKETEAALACQQSLLTATSEAGFYPYRLDILTMNKLINQNNAYWDIVKKVKDSLDPHNIISPGRYSPDTFSDK